jgi:hypothetical protein
MPSLGLTAISAAQALLLVLSYMGASSVAGHATTLSRQTSAGSSFGASSATTFLESSIASITGPSSGFATTIRTATTTNTDFSAETAAAHVNIALAAAKDNERREDCLLHHPTCLCDYQAKRTWYMDNCETFIFFKPKCWNKPELARFCSKGEENGPPAIKPSPEVLAPEAKPKPEDEKKHENCWADGIPPDDCEAPERHRGGPL